MSRILVVDDNATIVNTYREIFEQEDFVFASTDNADQALELAETFQPRIVFLDIDLKGDGQDRTGVQILSRLRERWSQQELPVIVISGVGDTTLLIELMQKGADDYEVKPVEDFKGLLDKVRGFLNRTAQKNQESGRPVEDTLVGKSKLMINLTKNILHLAQNGCDTLILGETGTGKDLVARIYHRLSPRHKKPFYSIDCTKISSSIFESELFGYAAGAFSGAKQTKRGLIEEAHGGIAFLNEIGELPLEQQAKILTLLESKTITRVGSTTPIQLDIIIVAATNRDLKAMVEAGTLRKDLYYRLYNNVVINPPLRDHREDIPLLIDQFILEYNQKSNKSIAGCEPDVVAALQGLPWEGNVRELKKCVESAVKKCVSSKISLPDIQPFLEQAQPLKAAGSPISAKAQNWDVDYQTLKTQLKAEAEEKEREYLRHHLNKHKYNIGKTAAAIGINNYQQLNQVMKRLKIE